MRKKAVLRGQPFLCALYPRIFFAILAGGCTNRLIER